MKKTSGRIHECGKELHDDGGTVTDAPEGNSKTEKIEALVFFYWPQNRECVSHLQVFDSEDHRLRQVNLVALLVNGCSDNR